MAAEEGAAGVWQSAVSGIRAGISDSISSILRIGKALLLGFIKTLLQRFRAHPLQEASREQPAGEDALQDEIEGEDIPDVAQVTSLRDCMLRIWQELSNNPEITCMVESVPGNRPLQELAEISEHLFATGINWGRIVVFFYFAYRVIEQYLRNTLSPSNGTYSSVFNNVVNWAMGFIGDRLTAWIERQGGWIDLQNYTPSR